MNLNNGLSIISSALEAAYDIPFVIKADSLHSDPIITIRPKHTEDLFSLAFKFRQKTRLTVEFQPDKYAAPMFEDMASNSTDRKQTFVDYAVYLQSDFKATMEMRINEARVSVVQFDTWPQQWRSFYFRLTKSPITDEDESFDPIAITKKWAVVLFGMFLSLLDLVPIETEEITKYSEGSKAEVVVTKYERNPLNRQLCIAANGCYCNICGFDFEKVYGEIGIGFIHVHHIDPVSSYGGERHINPVKDLIPVCPNCHAMLHRRTPPFSPDEIRSKIINND